MSARDSFRRRKKRRRSLLQLGALPVGLSRALWCLPAPLLSSLALTCMCVPCVLSRCADRDPNNPWVMASVAEDNIVQFWEMEEKIYAANAANTSGVRMQE